MMNASAMWDDGDPTLAGPSQEDYNNFLGISMGNLSESLQFDFADFNPEHEHGGQLMQPNDGDAMDTQMEGVMAASMTEPMPSIITTPTSHTSIQGTPITHGMPSTESLVELDAQIRYLQEQRQQEQQRQMQQNYFVHNRMIPPTPNSTEMHSNGHYYRQTDPQQQAMYERYRMQAKEQEMAFTPLVSPAVTPHETHFHMPEFTIPGAYFSPLSSPAMRAQREQSSMYDQRHTATTNSPVDLHMESRSAPGSTILAARRPNKKPQKARSIRSTKQSPIVKPRKSKKGSSTNVPGLADIVEPPDSQVSRSTAATSSTASTESENGSISPEHLSDMAPPPIPATRSTTRSPYISVQKENSRPHPPGLVLGPPATPASLMRLTQSPQVHDPAGNQNMDIDQGMEGFALPEAAATTGRAANLRIDTMSDGQMTPTLASSGQKTPGFQPLPSPAFTRPPTTVPSSTSSPQLAASTQTSTPTLSSSTRKTPLLTARPSKKRPSTSSMHSSSPALLPKFSPNIKPLLPGSNGAKSTSSTTFADEETASFLLTTKSNYQNIIEGTNPPGVSYPRELETNLTSKRTSHKLAEQGRRNRINLALQEIAGLLPRNGSGGKDLGSGGERSEGGGGGENGSAGGGVNGSMNGSGKAGSGAQQQQQQQQSANSKASTVEHAIEYIKQLRRDLEVAEKRAEEAERKLRGLEVGEEEKEVEVEVEEKEKRKGSEMAVGGEGEGS